ncbi:uncharacterized protein GGS22DRAFT_171263 [Annulohypoxylon maeteangense]|uniref:uncharacterized protein n=1 Tax=Annulohypoxylon maeteangense TaxID=1927788 RepID=UPI0020086BC3|nr:uncharacterized protein GGS22DRAFT_171263 [Annulohypoxylon maeteangense]KAI0881979.1 hypothetical protein GGS22DRAFT_171263 [Annulohypoxylon maeteangense]
MEGNDEEPIIDHTSDKTLSDLRELSIQCRALLHQLPATAGPEAIDLMASFNIWAANMGVFREGRQSLTSRLKSAPEISELVQQLLVALKRDLEKVMLQLDSKEEISSASESDDSSDRSSISSYRQPQVFKDLEASPPRSTIWTSIQNTTTSLRQLALSVRQAGTQHRQERIQRFKNIDRNKQVYQLIERCAHQKVDHMFPKASKVLRERMAESIATRRMRFSYLEQHQKKTSTLNEPAPELRQDEAIGKEEESALPMIELAQQRVADLGLRVRPQPSVVLSTTVVTKLDPKGLNPAQNKLKRTESVSSVKISTGKFPSIPKLDPGRASFTCPYCFLVCPAKEASGQSQWMSHLIHDFEPFFCVFDNCTSPFTCTDTYTGWLAHMRDTHTQPEWHCWHCKTSSSPFSTAAELESHLVKHHREEVTESLRPTLVKHSLVRDQHPLRECPFCGGFPEEIEKTYPDRDSKQAREVLEKHVRDHLVSTALILAPVEMGEPGDGLDDTKSDAQRDGDSERDLDGVGEIYELQCENNSCDCKESNKNSGSDWPMDSGLDVWEMVDTQAISNITQRWQYILDRNMGGEGVDLTLEAFAAKSILDSSPLIIDVPYTGDDDNTMEGDKDKQFLRSLGFTDPRRDKSYVEHIRGGLLPDINNWIHRDPDFQQWQQDPQGRPLWITGGPGTGKTMLLCSIVYDLETELDDHVAYFFCTATNSEWNNATAVLRGLIYLLIIRQPPLISQVRQIFDLGGLPPFEEAMAWDTTSEILKAMFNDPRLGSAFLIIDNIDKCTTNRAGLLDLITNSPPHIKWVVSSHDLIDNVKQPAVLHLELNRESNSTAIRAFIQHKVELLAEQKHYDSETKDEVQRYLNSYSSGNFIWVVIVYEKLQNIDNGDIAEIIGKKNTDLRGLYEQMIHNLNKNDRRFCRHVLYMVDMVYAPIHLEELQSLSLLYPNIGNPEDDVTRIITLCSSLLTIKDHHIQIPNGITKEILLSNASIIYPNSEQHHLNFFFLLKQHLSLHLRRNIYGLSGPRILINGVLSPDPDPLNSMRYSCVYIFDHLINSYPIEIMKYLLDGGPVHTFIQKTYLYWLECLILIGEMPKAVNTIHRLWELAKSNGARQLEELLKTAHEFIVSYKLIIESTPLQMYALAGMFSPIDSLDRGPFFEEKRNEIRLRLSKETAHDDRVESLAFGANGGWLASGSLEGTIKIWDTIFGETLQLLKSESSWATQLAFSADDKQLASGSLGIVEVWDTATGVRLWSHPLGNADVMSLVFSADSQRLASGDSSRRVNVWDAKTGDCLYTHIVDFLLNRLSFDPTNNSCLYNDTEVIYLDPFSEISKQEVKTVPPEDSGSRCSISADGRWIMKNGKESILLPHLYASSAIVGSMVAIGGRFGQVWVIDMDWDLFDRR